MRLKEKKKKEISEEQLMNELLELRKKNAEWEKLAKEMKQSIERLTEFEERYRNIVEMSPNGIVTVDLKGRITACNRAFFEETGHSKEEIIGKKFTRLPHLPKRDIQKNLKIFGSLLKGKIPKPLRFEWIQKDGTKRTSEAYISPLKKEGKIAEILAIAMDITEQKRTEDTLRINEQKYSNLFHHSNDAIIIHDQDGNILDVNKRAMELFGLKKSEILERKVPDLHPESELEISKKAFQTVKKDGFVNFECLFQKKNKEVFPAEVSSSLFKVGSQRLIQGVVRDITERKKAEHVLSESEKKFRSLVENANDAIYIITHQGFQYVNPAFEQLSGYTSKEVCKKTFDFWNIIHPDDVKMIKDREAARKEGKDVPSRYEFRILAKDGKTKIVEPATVSIGEKGEAKVIGILRDVTERRQTEEQIRTSLREKDVLLREIHHRVKNNMQIISSLLRLQSRLIKDRKMVEMFKESQNRIRSMALIHEKLYQTDDLSRINFAEYIRSLTVHLFHTYRVNPNIVKMNTEVEEVYLSINKAIPCGLVINELVSNALKHAFPEGKKGEIQIKLYSNRTSRTKLVVSDDGIGLPENLNIREPDTLGLQLVNDLVKQIEGTIKLDTVKGTTFYISF
jgi:PAS domain S-box-containing protein